MYQQQLETNFSRIYEVPFEASHFVTEQLLPELALEDGNRSDFGNAVFYRACETTDKSRKVRNTDLIIYQFQNHEELRVLVSIIMLYHLKPCGFG